MKLEDFNKLELQKVREELLRCCGSTHWVNEMMRHLPFKSIEELKKTSDAIWKVCRESDFLEAFSHHPKIGEKKARVSSGNERWSEQEQSGMNRSDEAIKGRLHALNIAYENKFGFIYIVCATGKSASEMLTGLEERMNNTREKEIQIAATEQNKITHLRIDKLLE